MKLEVFIDSMMQENTYLYYDENTKEAIIIDPALCIDKEKEYIKDNNIDLKYIILTHSHADHISDVLEIKEMTGAKIVAGKNEREMLIDAKKNLSADFFGQGIEFEADIYVSEGDELDFCNHKLSFVETPGHTTGGICIQYKNKLFTGDTLFKGSIGRTDLYGGDYQKMLKSLEKLKKLDSNLKIYPGHGPSSTIGVEIKDNPYLKMVK